MKYNNIMSLADQADVLRHKAELIEGQIEEQFEESPNSAQEILVDANIDLSRLTEELAEQLAELQATTEVFDLPEEEDFEAKIAKIENDNVKESIRYLARVIYSYIDSQKIIKEIVEKIVEATTIMQNIQWVQAKAMEADTYRTLANLLESIQKELDSLEEKINDVGSKMATKSDLYRAL